MTLIIACLWLVQHPAGHNLTFLPKPHSATTFPSFATAVSAQNHPPHPSLHLPALKGCPSTSCIHVSALISHPASSSSTSIQVSACSESVNILRGLMTDLLEYHPMSIVHRPALSAAVAASSPAREIPGGDSPHPFLPLYAAHGLSQNSQSHPGSSKVHPHLLSSPALGAPRCARGPSP